MKKSINLYSESLKPVKYWLTLTNVAAATGFVLLLMGAWYAKQFLAMEKTRQKAQLISQQVSDAKKELEIYQKALLKNNDSATFNEKKLELEQKVKVKRTLLTSVANRSSDKSVNYYHVMRDLTEHHDHDLWLTSFTFSDDNVVFDGFATQSKSVTQWMTYLQNADTFKGKELSHLNITAVDDELIQFQAATKVIITEEEISPQAQSLGAFINE